MMLVSIYTLLVTAGIIVGSGLLWIIDMVKDLLAPVPEPTTPEPTPEQRAREHVAQVRKEMGLA